jgi:ABC-2 type transport system permease protein
MRKLFAASIRMLFRDRQALFWALAFPVIFAVVFGLFDFGQAPKVTIAMTGESTSPVLEPLATGLGRVDSFTVERRADLAAARSDLEDGELDVVVSVEQTSNGAGLEVLYNAENFDANEFALTTIRQIVDGMNLQAAGVSRPAVTLTQ